MNEQQERTFGAKNIAKRSKDVLIGASLGAIVLITGREMHVLDVLTESADVPTAACVNKPHLSLEEQRQGANECLAVRAGSVALVAYDISEQDANIIARRAESTIERTTERVLRPKIIVTMPTPELSRAYNEKNPKDCAEDGFSESNGAILADEYLDLDQHSVVMSATPLQNCRPETGGIADSSGRYVSVYRATAGSYNLDEVIAHEYLHSVGVIDHASRVSTQSEAGVAIDIDGDQPANISSDYLPDSRLEEYGEKCNVMGDSNTPSYLGVPFAGLNPIQKHAITWPDRVIAKVNATPVPATEFRLQDQPIVLDASRGQYAVMQLDVPIEIPHKGNSDKKSPVFTEIAFEQVPEAILVTVTVDVPDTPE